MTLDSAVSEFESEFQTITSREVVDKTVPLTWSGGTANWDGLAPTLYLTAEHSIQAWLDIARQNTAQDDLVLEWIQKPELKHYQITMTDKYERHRVVSDRYAVKSQFVTSKAK